MIETAQAAGLRDMLAQRSRVHMDVYRKGHDGLESDCRICRHAALHAMRGIFDVDCDECERARVAAFKRSLKGRKP